MRTILKEAELFKWTQSSECTPKSFSYSVNSSKNVELHSPTGFSIYNFLVSGPTTKDIYLEFCENGLYELNFFLDDNTDINLYSGNRVTGTSNLHVVSTVFHKEKSSCNQDFRFVVDDNAVASFKGVIVIDKDAVDVESHMQNKNILLKNTAKVYSKPQLKIDNNQVKCSHGSTTGSLDKDQMFYLQSRGLDKDTSKEILIDAFLKEVSKIEHD